MINTQHPRRSSTPRAVTLRQHDSINLSTGVVTRSDQAWGSILPGHVEGIRANDLESLHSAMRCDQSIPMVDAEGIIPLH